MFNESGDVAVLGVMEHGRCEVAVVANRGERKRLAHLLDPAAGLLRSRPRYAAAVLCQTKQSYPIGCV